MAAAPASDALTKHGFPRGYRFEPHILEIVDILANRLSGQPLPQPVAGIFHDIRVLDYHPRQLYEQYKAYQEAGYIYFFSIQEYRAPAVAKGCARDDGKKNHPQRQANGGVWKTTAAAKPLSRPRSKGGSVVGKMVTMVFYSRWGVGAEDLFKSKWAMQEFTVCVGPNELPNLAVYRLYKMKHGGANGENGENQQLLENGVHNHHAPPAADEHHVPPAADDHHAPSASSSAAAGTQASSSVTGQASSSSQEQKQLISTEHQAPSTSTCAAGTSSSVTGKASTSRHQDQKQLTISIEQQIQHYHNQYTAMPGKTSIWVQKQQQEEDHTKPTFQQFVSPSLPEITTVNSPWEQQQSPVTDPSGVASPVAPAMSQFAAGHDETMKEEAPSSSQLEVVPSEQQLVRPPNNMSALLNEDDVPNDLIPMGHAPQHRSRSV